MDFWKKINVFNFDKEFNDNFFNYADECKKCGKKNLFVWHIIKCSRCNNILMPDNNNSCGVVKPLHDECTICGCQKFIVETTESIRAELIDYSIARKVCTDGINYPIIMGNNEERIEISIQPVCKNERSQIKDKLKNIIHLNYYRYKKEA